MKKGFTTTILHADRQAFVEHNAVHKPMHTSVAFGYENAGDLVDVFQGVKPGYVYGRQGTPTTAALETKITLMEDGLGTVSFSTGMAALTAIFLSLLKAGDHLIASQYLFGNTNSFLDTLRSYGIEVTTVDAIGVSQVANALQENTKMVFVETIANPRTQIVDLAGIGDFCEQHGLVYVVDNTMTGPYLFQPKTVKASLSMNSLTKYIGGHGNALGGAVTDTGLYDWAAYPNINQSYRHIQPSLQGLTQIRKKGLRDLGASLSAESAHRIAVGAETMVLRQRQACQTALRLAKFLESHELIQKVYYPGLSSHAQHERARTLFKDFGALMSIELAEHVDVIAFMNALQVPISSTHLGDNRTLAIPVAKTIYWEMGPQRRAEMGIAEGLIRLSIGIEDSDDLLNDFEQALNQVMP